MLQTSLNHKVPLLPTHKELHELSIDNELLDRLLADAKMQMEETAAETASEAWFIEIAA